MHRSNNSDAFSFDEASQDIHLTLTPSQADISSTYTPYVETERVKVIWGTTINVQNTSEKFKELVRSSSVLRGILDDMNTTQEYEFPLDCELLDECMFKELLLYPQEVLPILHSSLQEVYSEMFVESGAGIRIRPYNIGNKVNIRNIDTKELDRIVQISGMVVRASGIIPEIRKALFKCVKCGMTVEVDSIKDVINEPSVCECGSKYTLQIAHNESVYTDKQVVRLQELPDNMPDGTTPATVTIVSKEGLVDKLIAGDRVLAVGILRAVPVRINPNFKKIKSTFRVFLELLSTQTMTKTHTKNDDYIEEIDRLRKMPDVYEILSGSIASSIYGMENVKKAILLQLFGGVVKDLGSSRLRGDINILLVGDPGIAKSQILGFVHSVTDRGMYTSGRGSSAVGLTASVSKDPDSGQYILESGALVLSDNGICCVDEFDKMNENTKSVLHEVMEQQTVSVAKAGIIATLNARCALLASSNPIESKYNVKKTIVENVHLPPTLLSRFDLVCVLIDKPDERNDDQVARHIFRLYSQDTTNETRTVPIAILKAYIKEARKIVPQLTDDSMDALSKAYVELRQLDDGKTITATTRQLESLVRLSEAHAKMRFSKTVDVSDVREAIRLVKESLLLYAVDPGTGMIDMAMVMTGKSAAMNKLFEDLKAAVVKLVSKKMSVEDIMKATKADEKLLKEVLEELETEEVVYVQNNIVERLR